MKQLSDFKNEEALDLLVDLIDPAADIFSDKKIVDIIRGEGSKIEAVKVAIKEHKAAVMQIMAALDGVPVEEYSCNVFTLPIKLLEILNDKELISFFTSQVQMMEETSSGPVTESTKASRK